IGFFSVDEFHAIASGDLDVELDATLAATGRLFVNVPISITVFDKRSYFVDFIGPVPIEETIRFTVSLRCQGYAEPTGTVMAGVGLARGVAAGARSENGNGSGVASAYSQPRLIGPTTGGQQSEGFRCFLRPRVDLYFYDLLGPGIYVEPYAKYDQ